ncbi:hypothetical protein P9X10_02475 [Bacillus cereus]|nr:hypothetical protein [Bacillus cereus]
MNIIFGLSFFFLTTLTFVQIVVYMMTVLFYVKNNVFYTLTDMAFRMKTSNTKIENMRRFRNEIVKLSALNSVIALFCIFLGLESVLGLMILRSVISILLVLIMTYELRNLRVGLDSYTKILRGFAQTGVVILVLLTIFHTVGEMLLRF